MTRIRLPYIHAIIDRHGHARHYFRRRGFPSITLPGKVCSLEFMEAYQAAMAGEATPRIEIGASRIKPGTVASSVAGYFQSPDYLNLAATTQRERRFVLERFRLEHGDKGIATLQRQHLERMIAGKKPGAGYNFLTAIRSLLSHAVRVGLRQDNPALGIPRPRQKSAEGIYTWSDSDIGRFEAAHPIGTRARLALALLLYTAQRRSDVIRLGRQHVREGVIHIRQQKTGRALSIPVHPELQRILDATPATDQLTFLTTRRGRPFAPSDFSHWFKDRCREAGLPEEASVHGLRKSAARRLAEAGCSANVIASITGHRSLKEVERYTRAADQERMARAGIEAVSGERNRNRPVETLVETLPASDRKS